MLDGYQSAGHAAVRSANKNLCASHVTRVRCISPWSMASCMKAHIPRAKSLCEVVGSLGGLGNRDCGCGLLFVEPGLHGGSWGRCTNEFGVIASRQPTRLILENIPNLSSRFHLESQVTHRQSARGAAESLAEQDAPRCPRSRKFQVSRMTRFEGHDDPPQTASHAESSLMIYMCMQRQSNTPLSVARDLLMSARLKQKHNTGK
jgi:hypothetical protein